MFYQIESPPAKRFIDLPLVIPPFVQKKAKIRVTLGPWQAEFQHQVEIGKGARRNCIASIDNGGRLLDSYRMDRCAGARFPDGRPQETEEMERRTIEAQKASADAPRPPLPSRPRKPR